MVTIQTTNVDKNLTFVKFTNQRCRVFRNGTEFIGELCQVRQDYYLRWGFSPAPCDVIGRLTLSKRHMLQIADMITVCHVNKVVPNNVQQLYMEKLCKK